MQTAMYIYYENILFTRVTSLLKKYQNFSNIDPTVLRKKAKIGTKTHENIEYYLNYKMHPKDFTEYYPSFIQFDKEKRFTENEILATEHRIFSHDYLVTGAIDCIVNFQGELALIDWKTSSDFYEEYMSLQTCIYKILYDNDNFLKIDNCYVVLLKNYPSYIIYQVDVEKYIPLAYEILENNINALSTEMT